MQTFRRDPAPIERGYSLAEALVVVAIVGLISLISIPSFVSINRANKLKTSLRQFTNDMRLIRQRAVSKTRRVKLSFQTGVGRRSYYIYEQPVPLGAWVQSNGGKLRRDCPKLIVAGPFPNGCLDESVYFSATTFTDDAPADTLLDVVFTPSGGVSNINTPPNTITLTTRYRGLTKSNYLVQLGASGGLTSN